MGLLGSLKAPQKHKTSCDNKFFAILFLTSVFQSLLLGREPCGDGIWRSCLQKAPATARSNYEVFSLFLRVEWKSNFSLGQIGLEGSRQVYVQERKRHINLRKSLGHRPGVPGTPGGTNGVYRPVSQGFPFIYNRQKGRKRPSLAWCPRDTWTCRWFSESLCEFFLCAFSAPYMC